MKDTPVIVARIVSPFGRRGEVKSLLETDFPEEFAGRKSLLVTDGAGNVREHSVEQIRFHKGAALVKLAGIDSIDDAETLRGKFLAIWPQDRAKLGRGEYWLDEIVGLQVYTEDGRPLGKITEVIRGPANDVWVTPKAMIPVVDEFVLSVDVPGDRVVVRFVEGMET
ncbi:MAG: 16S rRNA processing protein RimM [Armatimonadetes bacterium]|nr:16S rRNA processing protein RimM [Armatimonadota bacterium]